MTSLRINITGHLKYKINNNQNRSEILTFTLNFHINKNFVNFYPGVIDPTELVPLLPRDHEGRQVGCVDGEEDDREQSPDRSHKPVI